MKHFNCNKKIVLALLCALTTLSVVSGINTKNTKQLRGSIDDNNVRVLHGKGSTKTPKSSKMPGSKGKGGKGGKKGLKCKKGKKNKSSKMPSSKGKGDKKNKSSKMPSSKGKGGKGSSKTPSSKGKGRDRYSTDCDDGQPPAPAPTTNECNFTNEQRTEGIRTIVETVSRSDELNDDGSAQNLAFNWLISDDSENSLVVCPDDETLVLQRYILALVYYATDGDEWDRCTEGSNECFTTNRGVVTEFEPYLSKEDVCSWFGIECTDDNVVTKVKLGQEFFVGVNGEIPTELFSLPMLTEINFDGSEDSSDTRRIRGTISPLIENVPGLQRLDLDRNELTGPIPDKLFELTDLTLLDLDNNQLTGKISDQFENLTKLFFLTIGNNNFGKQQFPTALSTLSNIRFLALQNSNLEGAVPAGLGDLVKMESLDLSSNALTGNIAFVEKYDLLSSLTLRDNEFSGAIPNSLWSNKNMLVIDLETNTFDGEISSSVGEMSNLITLRLAGNGFTGLIPQDLGNLKMLTTLTLENNNFDAGASVPAELCDIANIQITIDSNIACPGGCCTVV